MGAALSPSGPLAAGLGLGRSAMGENGKASENGKANGEANGKAGGDGGSGALRALRCAARAAWPAGDDKDAQRRRVRTAALAGACVRTGGR